MQAKKIEISHRTVIFTLGLLLSLWVLYQIRSVVLLAFVALILMAALNPSTEKLVSLRVPRILAIAIIYLLLLLAVAGIVAGIVPPLVEQTGKLVIRLPEYLSDLGVVGFDQQFVANQLSGLGQLPENIVKISLGIFSNVVALFTLLVLTFYMLLERKNLGRYLAVLLGEGKETKIVVLVEEVERRLGGWVRGELALMTIVGVMVYVGLRLLNVEFALPLALLAGLFEVVPNLGPFLSAIPAVLLGLSISPVTGLAVAAMYFLVQQFENSVIVPKVMQKSTGVNPLVTIIALVVGYELAGVIGAILAVPVSLVAGVVLKQVSEGADWSLKGR